MADLTTKISIIDTDIFINLVDTCKRIVADDRVPSEYKQEIQTAIKDARQRKDGRAKVFYECDGLACEECNSNSCGHCHHTSDIRHAKNFEKLHETDTYREKILEAQP